MTKKNVDLINEGVVRRWGKLANLNKLTESFLDNTEVVAEEEEEELEVELPADESEGLEDAAPEMEAELDADMALEPEVALDEDQVEALTVAFASALSQVTGVEVEVEAEGGDEMPADELEAPAPELGDEMPADELEPELGDEELAFNRNDETTEEENTDTEDDTDQVTEASETEATDTDEDDAEDKSADLTEAVLKRVIERLLATK